MIDRTKRRLKPTRGLIAGGLICLVVSALWAQTQPAFEAASVKLSDPKDPAAAIEFGAGGRFAANIGLKYVIERAYDVEDYQVSGDPDWLKSDRYAFQAKTQGAASQDQVRLMVQTLLAERFRLKIRRESRDLPVYALVVDKNGPKLPVAKDPTLCDGHGCFGIGRGNFTASGATLPWTAKVLNRILDRPVVDKTQIAGNYDFKLHFDPSSAFSPMMATPAARNAPDLGEPSIFTAIQEQIGLKLDPRKEPVEVLVIEHVERPSEN